MRGQSTLGKGTECIEVSVNWVKARHLHRTKEGHMNSNRESEKERGLRWSWEGGQGQTVMLSFECPVMDLSLWRATEWNYSVLISSDDIMRFSLCEMVEVWREGERVRENVRELKQDMCIQALWEAKIRCARKWEEKWERLWESWDHPTLVRERGKEDIWVGKS